MSRDVLDKAFEPFFTTKPVGKGTGLGLAMVYGTVKQSKGHVTIESREGYGTSVTISLPAQAPEATEKKEAAATLVKGDATVVMVEDEKSVNETVTAFLDKLGYKVHPFYSGEEALAFLSEEAGEQPDILLTDVILSGMNGKELSDRVREIFPGIRVVYMSGYASDKLADKGIVPSDLTLLYKPFSIFELGETLGRVLGAEMRGDSLLRH
jgi:CheY-like chemotaxis protein